jgi:hypothetical protein
VPAAAGPRERLGAGSISPGRSRPSCQSVRVPPLQTPGAKRGHSHVQGAGVQIADRRNFLCSLPMLPSPNGPLSYTRTARHEKCGRLTPVGVRCEEAKIFSGTLSLSRSCCAIVPNSLGLAHGTSRTRGYARSRDESCIALTIHLLSMRVACPCIRKDLDSDWDLRPRTPDLASRS